MPKEMTLFKIGKHLPNYTDADLAATVAAYDPAVHEAPIVIGHPRTDSPAFGWIDSVSAVGDALMGTPKQVAANFSEWVRQGYWKKRSASFYPPGHTDHPLGADSDVYYLKHVGYLGANPPKVKGMPDFEFCEDPEEGLLTIDFGEDVSLDFGDWEMNELRDRLKAIELIVFPESKGSVLPVALSEQELQEREAAIALRERATTLKEQELQFSEALDGVIKEGRVIAAEKPAHLKRLKMLAAIPADSVVDFAEGKADYSPTAEYLEELKKRPVLVNFSEISGGEVPNNIAPEPAQQARAIDKRRAEAAKEGRVLSFAEADAELRNGGKN
jgi:hypothetical protein